MVSNLQIVSFFIEDYLYGLDIRIVKEINPTTDVCLVPRTQPHIRGLVNIRGQVVLVLDVAIMFGREPRLITEDSQIVIFKNASEIQNVRNLESDTYWSLFGNKPIGILVDRIGDAFHISASELETTPRHIEKEKARFFSGVVNLEEELLMLLNAGEILSYGATIPGGEI
jgi:purine-binding chemotaxis protein CheW